MDESPTPEKATKGTDVSHLHPEPNYAEAIPMKHSGARIGIGEPGDGNPDAVDPHPDHVLKAPPVEEAP